MTFTPRLTRKGDQFFVCRNCGHPLNTRSVGRMILGTIVEDYDAEGSTTCPDGKQHNPTWSKKDA